MLLEQIARYYNILWLILAAIAFVKIIISYSFQSHLEGINGVLFALFKWFNEQEQEMEDFGHRRTVMRLLNMITLMIYGMLLVIFVATMLPKLVGR